MLLPALVLVLAIAGGVGMLVIITAGDEDAAFLPAGALAVADAAFFVVCRLGRSGIPKCRAVAAGMSTWPSAMCSSNDNCMPGLIVQRPLFPPVPRTTAAAAAVLVPAVVGSSAAHSSNGLAPPLPLPLLLLLLLEAARRSKYLLSDNTCLTELRHVPFAVWKNGKFRCM